MKTKLVFKFGKKLRQIIDHARKNVCVYPYTETEADTAGLWLVKDKGVYVMSAAPGNHVNGRFGPVHVVYAQGFDPKADEDVWERAREAVGEDDFAAFFSLDDLTIPPDAKELVIADDRNKKTFTVQVV